MPIVDFSNRQLITSKEATSKESPSKYLIAKESACKESPRVLKITKKSGRISTKVVS